MGMFFVFLFSRKTKCSGIVTVMQHVLIIFLEGGIILFHTQSLCQKQFQCIKMGSSISFRTELLFMWWSLPRVVHITQF